MRNACIIAVLIIRFIIIAHSLAEDDKTSMEDEFPPFIQTEAEKWSFDEQIRHTIKDYLGSVKNRTRDLLRIRKLQRAKLPDFSESLIFEEPPNSFIWKSGLRLRNNWVEDLSNVDIIADDKLRYNKMDLAFNAYLKHLRLRFVQDFTFERDKESHKGRIEGRATNVSYSLSLALNFNTKEVKLKQLRLGCFGEIGVELKGIPSFSWMNDPISRVVLKSYKGPIFADIVTIIRSALEDAFEFLDIRERLPKLNYEKIYSKLNDNEKSKKIIMCKSNGENGTPDKKLKAKWNTSNKNGHLPFIQNEAEMWSFERQIKDKANDFVEYLVYHSTNYFFERRLEPTKMPSFLRQFSSEDQSGVKRYGDVALRNGWVLNLYKLRSQGVHLVEVNGRELLISSYVHVMENVSFSQDYSANIRKISQQGSVKGSLDHLKFLLEVLVDLDELTATVKDFRLNCVGAIDIQVKCSNDEFSWIERGISKVATDVIRGLIQEDMERVLRHTIEYVASNAKVGKYMPNWSYGRSYELGAGAANGSTDVDKICNVSFVNEVAGKTQGDHTAIKPTAVPFLNTHMESWYFGEQLKIKMNAYINYLFHQSVNIILIRDLRRAKMADERHTIDAEDFKSAARTGELFFKNSWVEDLSSVHDGGVDYLAYDEKEINLTSHLQIWWNLNFNSEFTFNASKTITKGKVEGEVRSVIYFLKIRVHYMGPQKVKLEQLRFKCLGDISVEVKGLTGSQKWMKNSISADAANMFKRQIIRDATDIFRRSLEDAISNSNITEFIPEWNYQKSYGKKYVRKDRHDFPMCNDTENKYPIIEPVSNGVNIVGFEEVLPQIQTFALRLSLQQTMKKNMNGYLNEVWNGAWHSIVNRYAEPKLGKYSRLFSAEDDQGEMRSIYMILFNGSNSGFTSTSKLKMLDMAYGENDEVILLFAQQMSSLEVRLHYNLTAGNANHSGTVEGRIENVTNLIKSRFSFKSKRLDIEDYDLYCVESTGLEIQGLNGEYAWLRDGFTKEAVRIFSGSIIDGLWMLMRDILIDAIPKGAERHYIPKWMYEKELYEIVTANENRKERYLKELRECLSSGNRSVKDKGEQYLEYKRELPFIQTEGEWRTFHNQMKNKMHGYRRSLWRLASTFLVGNDLGKLKLQNVTRYINSTDPTGSEAIVEINLKNGMVEDISILDEEVSEQIMYNGTEIILTSQISFTKNIKFHHDFMADLENTVLEGNILGTADSLTYVFKARISLDSKIVKLEDLRLTCIGDIKTEIKGAVDEFAWLADSISEMATKEFLEFNLNDVQKIIRIAFESAVSIVDVGHYHYLPDWNYRRHAPKEIEGDDGIFKCDIQSENKSIKA